MMYNLTSLGFAIHYNKERYVDVILTKAQENSILQDILASRNIVQYLNIIAYTLTPLNFTIYKGNNSIFIRAQNSDTLGNILTSKDIVQLTGVTYIIKPLAFAMYKGNNKCVDSILTRVQNSAMLQDTLTAVSTIMFLYG
uniref:WD_0033/WD_0034 family tandem repeat-containing protein n=1 Tax=Wolbachia endosymbiont of Trichogramma kaykai TaxID=444066 RepID=UPI0038918921